MTSSNSPEELTIAVNSPLELECSATGVPPPSLTWLKDGHPLELSDIVQEDGHFVRIRKVQVRNVFTVPFCNWKENGCFTPIISYQICHVIAIRHLQTCIIYSLIKKNVIT